MIGHRITLRAPLLTDSDLRIGSGTDEKDGESTTDMIILDHAQNPIIPATTLKGVLRTAMSEAQNLFGEITHHDKGTGHIGRLWFDDARLDPGTSANIFTKSNVAIDPDLGTAIPTRLFNRQFVQAGTRFTFAATWFGAADDPQLIEMLAWLARGVCIGATKSKGAGRVTLDLAGLAVNRFSIGPDGRPETTALDVQPIRRAVNSAKLREAAGRTSCILTLRCDGPFMSMGGQEGVDDPASDKVTKVTKPLDRDEICHLWPESLIGALRARACWIERLRIEEGSIGGINDVEPPEVTALFGSTKASAQIRIVSLNCTASDDANTLGQPVILSSVNIDRVTGGGIEGLLYSERVYWGVTFEVVLDLPEACPLWDRLIANLSVETLELGHGASKGYGWFDLEGVEA